ncbi:hypothetical protein THASP1DRAFT_27833 [Thamnocephalis sphaerospora]|uniref:Armadillo-type protein n=1 Tax=Thamnocephalis sphaerospora TaxID=78915 RepID=A0A4P9XVT5_9FUNG|nr:hypothetical protein THASP1DRAFT_27833 [Thamnocephalis sphaerospora]|eukprot:RKP10388.1 hypothetical protein THASP1DRAFT_27833 [Thamnocephalis sphaerospora]
MPIFTRLRTAMRKSWTAEEELQYIRDTLALPDTAHNVPKLVSVLQRIAETYHAPATAKAETAAAKLSPPVHAPEELVELSIVDAALSSLLLSPHYAVSDATLGLLERVLATRPAELLSHLPACAPALMQLADRLPEESEDRRAARAIDMVYTLLLQHDAVALIPYIRASLDAERSDTQLAAAELLVVVVEHFAPADLEDYITPLSEAVGICASSAERDMQQCAVRIYLPFLKIPSVDVKTFQNSISRDVQRNLSTALRVMLAERKYAEQMAAVTPGASLRARAFSAPPPMQHQVGSAAKDASTRTVKKVRKRVHTVNTNRSNSASVSDEGADELERAGSPRISVRLNVADVFADEANNELSRFMADDQVKEDGADDDKDTLSTGDGVDWDIRSAPDTSTAPAKTVKSAAIQRSISHDRLPRARMGSLRAGAQKIRQQVAIKSWFSMRSRKPSSAV